jgi:hypothetical protein
MVYPVGRAVTCAAKKSGGMTGSPPAGQLFSLILTCRDCGEPGPAASPWRSAGLNAAIGDAYSDGSRLQSRTRHVGALAA